MPNDKVKSTTYVPPHLRGASPSSPVSGLARTRSSPPSSPERPIPAASRPRPAALSRSYPERGQDRWTGTDETWGRQQKDPLRHQGSWAAVSKGGSGLVPAGAGDGAVAASSRRRRSSGSRAAEASAAGLQPVWQSMRQSGAADAAPSTPIANAPLGDHRAYQQLDWSQASEPRRSDLGRSGVRFVDFKSLDADGLPVVLTLATKTGRTIHQEFFATLLAQRLGIRTPEPLALYPTPSAAMQARLNVAANVPVMVMPLLVGASFRELGETVIEGLLEMTPAAHKTLQEAGEVYAFDYWIGNADRFPQPKLTTNNNGNLMITKAGDVVAIDSSASQSTMVGTADFFERQKARSGAILHVVHNPDDAAAQQVLMHVTRFFPDLKRPTPTDATLPKDPSALAAPKVPTDPKDPNTPTDAMVWAKIGPPFVAGLRKGLAAVAKLTERDIDAAVQAAGGTAMVGPGVVNFLKQNLDDICRTLATTSR